MTRKEYQANYFQNNKDKILAKRKARKQREKEAGQSQLFEESAAPLAKAEQQTINTDQSADESSISNVFELFPAKAVDFGYAMVGGLNMGPAEFVANPSRTTQVNSTPRAVKSSSDIWQPATTGQSVSEVSGGGSCASGEGQSETNRVPSQSLSGGEVNTVDLPEVDPEENAPVDQSDVDLSKVDQDNNCSLVIWERGRRPLSHFFVSAGILLLLGANTFFLVAEQLSLYESLGYGFKMAVLIAVLTECLLISLSLLSAWTSDWIWKGALLTGCLLTCLVVVNILDSSVQNRVSIAAENTGKAERLKKRIASLEKLEGTALAIIAKYDPEVYPTKVNGLMAKLEAQGPEGYSRRLREANDELDNISAAGSGNAEALLWQRRVAMLCNLILSGFLGFLWSSKSKSGLLSKVGQALMLYFRKPVQAAN